MEKHTKQQQKPPGESLLAGGKSRDFPPSITKMRDLAEYPSEPDMSNKSFLSGRNDLPPSPCQSREVYSLRKANRICLRCPDDSHNPVQWPKSCKPNCNDGVARRDGEWKDTDHTGGNRHIKRQLFFDTQKVNNWNTSPSMYHGWEGLTRVSWEWRCFRYWH